MLASTGTHLTLIKAKQTSPSRWGAGGCTPLFSPGPVVGRTGALTPLEPPAPQATQKLLQLIEMQPALGWEQCTAMLHAALGCQVEKNMDESAGRFGGQDSLSSCVQSRAQAPMGKWAQAPFHMVSERHPLRQQNPLLRDTHAAPCSTVPPGTGAPAQRGECPRPGHLPCSLQHHAPSAMLGISPARTAREEPPTLLPAAASLHFLLWAGAKGRTPLLDLSQACPGLQPPRNNLEVGALGRGLGGARSDMSLAEHLTSL